MAFPRISFFISPLIAIIVLNFYYNINFYPFEKLNLNYYLDNLNSIISYGYLNNEILIYLISLGLALIYHILSKNINTPVIFKGLITSFIVFIPYLIIQFLYFGIKQLAYSYTYLFRDLFGLIIYYFIISLIYRRK